MHTLVLASLTVPGGFPSLLDGEPPALASRTLSWFSGNAPWATGVIIGGRWQHFLRGRTFLPVHTYPDAVATLLQSEQARANLQAAAAASALLTAGPAPLARDPRTPPTPGPTLTVSDRLHDTLVALSDWQAPPAFANLVCGELSELVDCLAHRFTLNSGYVNLDTGSADVSPLLHAITLGAVPTNTYLVAVDVCV